MAVFLSHSEETMRESGWCSVACVNLAEWSSTGIGVGTSVVLSLHCSDVIDSFHISHHQYADDTNLYHSFSASDQQSCLETVSECLNSVNNWFLTNGLLVNPGKSDSIFIGTTVQTRKVDSSGVEMRGSKIPLSDKIKSLGVVFDQRLTFENHVKAVCRTCYFHIKSLRVLRPSLDTGTVEIIGRSIIMSRLDYCNSLLAFTSKRNIHRLQMVQNQWVVSGSGYRQSATPILFSPLASCSTKN
jgi:hypothetical protein